MLSPYEVAIFAVAVPLLLPLALYALITGAQPPETSSLARYYRAEPYLSLFGNLFLLAVCASAIARLGRHFGVIDASLAEALEWWINVPFAALLVASLGLWIKAALRVRRQQRSAS